MELSEIEGVRYQRGGKAHGLKPHMGKDGNHCRKGHVSVAGLIVNEKDPLAHAVPFWGELGSEKPQDSGPRMACADADVLRIPENQNASMSLLSYTSLPAQYFMYEPQFPYAAALCHLST